MSEQLQTYESNGDGMPAALSLPEQRTDAALAGAVQIESVDDVVRLGKMMAASGFFQDAKDTAKACVKILAGAELGISPVAAMRGVYVFDGNTTLNASLIGALIKRSGRYDYDVVKVNDQGAAIDFFEDGEERGRATFTMEDARQAGLTNKRNWKNYPSDMCFARAMTRGARRYCSEVFLGPIYTPDEMGQETDRQGNPVQKQSSQEQREKYPPEMNDRDRMAASNQERREKRTPAQERAETENAPDRTISQAQIKRIFAIGKNEGGWTNEAIKRYVTRRYGFDSLSDIPRGETYDRICGEMENEQLASKYARDPDTPDMFEGDESEETARDEAADDEAAGEEKVQRLISEMQERLEGTKSAERRGEVLQECLNYMDGASWSDDYQAQAVRQWMDAGLVLEPDAEGATEADESAFFLLDDTPF